MQSKIGGIPEIFMQFSTGKRFSTGKKKDLITSIKSFLMVVLLF